MKKLLLFLLVFPFCVNAQNWRSVPSGQHNIYRVSVNGVDSVWNNYLRNIFVKDSMIALNGMQYNFYPSIRRDATELLDSIKGPTWLGRFLFRENNGDEIFLNKYFDTIRIKTKAGLNQSWKFGTDSSSSKNFVATVVSMDTLKIDGTLDSIKRIDIQAYAGNTPVPSIYNGYQLVLSRKHGLYKAFDFYGFPNYEKASLLNNTASSNDRFPVLPYIHYRLDSNITGHNKWNSDLQFQYQVGNSWIIETMGTNSTYPSYSFDSIIAVNSISVDTIIITVQREQTYWTYVQANPSWIKHHTTGVYTDTILKAYNLYSLKNVKYEDQSLASIGGNSTPWKFLDSYCQNRFIFRDTSTQITAVSGNTFWSRRGYSGLHNFDIVYRMDTQTPGGMSFYTKFKYYNFNGCTYGTFFPLVPNSVTTFAKNNVFKIYPNPTSSLLHIESNKKWNQIEIISYQGQVVKKIKRDQDVINIDELPKGLYFLRISTTSNNYIEKLVID